MRPRLETITLSVDGKTIAGIRQRDPNAVDAPRLLCVHGWLDNANSFVPMMPYLPAFDLVAIDLPGHGYSDALPQGYTFHELCYQLTRIVEALEWDSCNLMGHSLGGCITPMLCVANPAIAESLILIEASGPLSESAAKLPERMVKSMQDRLNPARFQSRTFSTKDDAIKSRLKAAKMAPMSAKLIIDRQVKEIVSGYQWRFDPRWRESSSQYQTEEQVRAVLAAVGCKILAVVGDEGFLAKRPETQQRLDCLSDGEVVILPGHHHLHMDTPEPVAAAVNRFLGALPNMGG